MSAFEDLKGLQKKSKGSWKIGGTMLAMRDNEDGPSWVNGAANRLYYAIFQVADLYLIKRKIHTNTSKEEGSHAKVVDLIENNTTLKRKVSEEQLGSFQELKDFRKTADYYGEDVLARPLQEAKERARHLHLVLHELLDAL